MKKNRTALIALVAGAAVIVGGAWWFTSSHSGPQSSTIDPNDPDHKKAAEAYQKSVVHAGEMQAAAEQAYLKARERARKKAEATQAGTPPASSGATSAAPAAADTPK